MKIRALSDSILGTDADFGDQVTAGGIIIQDNSKKSQGITPRWFKVISVGNNIDWVTSGQWVLVQHGRWSDGIQLDSRDTQSDKVWKLDPNGCLMVSDTKPDTLYYNSDVIAT